ncbi:hypothetical protein [Rhizobium wenxiniae]|uniref:hypothetical protein n=1 Tax=Rhizobium wenxiniae TaxID=1737357 RepID=UPI003C26AF38
MFKQAQSLQFVWFLPGDPASPVKLFDGLLGGEPDAFQKIFPPQAPLPLTVQHIVRDGLVHKVQSHYGRIDYFIEPVQNGPSLGLIDDPMKVMNETLERILSFSEVVGDIVRGAVVANLSHPVASIDEAGGMFTQLFGDKINLSGAREINFQLSKRRSGSAVGDLNRLFRWSTETVTFAPMVGNALPSMLLANATETHYLNYMIDVNTVLSSTSRFAPKEHIVVFEALTAELKNLFSAETIESVL